MQKTLSVSGAINTLAGFLGTRDIPRLTCSALESACGIQKADVFALFGGSILAGGDLLAEAIKQGIAEKYIIVGGEGHTTESLRQMVHSENPDIDTAALPEAEVFAKYINARYGVSADLLETRSTNCGNNITLMLKLLDEHGVKRDSVILCQDAAMQRRMCAGMLKHAPGTKVINYAAYSARVTERGGELGYEEDIHGMWDIGRFVNLLMGEIPRLTDDENGYGPRGKDFIAHVDIPEEVRAAYDCLCDIYGSETRAANPVYADVKNT